MGETILISGNANIPLAEKIAEELGIGLTKVICGRFADGEINIEICQSIRGKDIYIIQPTCRPVNDNLMEALLLISACRRSSARQVTLVVPYFGYARQDRKMKARAPISAADVARLFCAMKPDRLISVDLHCGQIQGFFPPNIVLDNLQAFSVPMQFFVGLNLEKPIIISPDGGGVYRAQRFMDLFIKCSKKENVEFAMLNKQRKAANEVDNMKLVGSVQDGDCIIIDDMIDTAGTLCLAAKHLKENGARTVYAFATHGLFNNPAVERITNSDLTKVIVTDSVPPMEDVVKCDKIQYVSISVILANAIEYIQDKATSRAQNLCGMNSYEYNQSY
uniref:ribose-phosphate diphosphokinase n=1 Tax=Dermatophagoides pteronyssinus TaxID=6956 RepID=A0A6P6XQ17_DERPT|nr:uncharacterized protein LOC113788703 [Dermatophagoides pteronyssinus]